MANVLCIIASPREESWSSRLADGFLTTYRQLHPEDSIEMLDLFSADIPPFTAPQAAAKYAVLGGQEPRDRAQAAWVEVIRTIEHFKSFDKYVLASPMWNFSIPYRLKQYLDVIVQPGLTFKFVPEQGYVGLVTGRPLLLLLARGGSYGAGNPCETMDFQESYLRAIAGFIGITDIHAVRVENTLMQSPEQVEESLQAAILEAGRLAEKFV